MISTPFSRLLTLLPYVLLGLLGLATVGCDEDPGFGGQGQLEGVLTYNSILSGESQPLAGAPVLISRSGDPREPWAFSDTTDANGRFAFNFLNVCSDCRYFIYAQHQEPFGLDTLRYRLSGASYLQSREQISQILQLDYAGQRDLLITVQDSQGHPLMRGEACVYPDSSSWAQYGACLNGENSKELDELGRVLYKEVTTDKLWLVVNGETRNGAQVEVKAALETPLLGLRRWTLVADSSDYLFP